MTNKNRRKVVDRLKQFSDDLEADENVTAILAVVANFQQEQELTESQAQAIDFAAQRPASKIKGRRLPPREEK